jgi:FkbM family methyltransferase
VSPLVGKKSPKVASPIVRALRGAQAALERLLPPLAYCKAQELIRPLLDARLRGLPTRSVLHENGVFTLRWSDGTCFHFPHQHRYGRYMQMHGTEHIYENILGKYQDGEVRVPSGGVVVEAGAHCGEFTAAAARIASRVYSFDPDPQVQRSLSLNTQQFSNVEIVQAALGAIDGEAEFYLATADADSSLFKPAAATEMVVVKVVRLESFLRDRQLDSVDFLKVEAEGAEPEILQGCGDALKKVRQVAIDCGPERYGQTTFAECNEILGEAGFETWRGSGRFNTLFGVNQGT